MILKKIRTLPIGYSEVIFEHKKYGVPRTDYNSGNSIKIYAEELGGKDFVSLNYYITSTSENLKPCEMSKEKVIHFIKSIKLLWTP